MSTKKRDLEDDELDEDEDEEEDEDMEKGVTDQVIAFNEDTFLASIRSTIEDAVAPIVADAVRKALSPIRKSLTALVDAQDATTEEMNEIKKAMEGIVEGSELIKGIVGKAKEQAKTEPESKQQQAVTTSVTDILTKGQTPDPVDGGEVQTDRAEAGQLITKAIGFREQHQIKVPGLTYDVISAFNKGVAISSQELAELRKGITQVEQQLAAA